ncbi:hypothetical protein N7532_006599 [Penicillium argentinense]|uniref:Chromatin assembly factor 1 subunit A n=1 Tax=Penicillium argentinense TaxID=1131581 RepID=A0A9W9KB27_9EURO|nr:uncharacterized protein N7532_006599 [Penicillium argentinense]KAJ5099598.1 hypothetical protein N7532_006599 [Penicillium argentinense]
MSLSPLPPPLSIPPSPSSGPRKRSIHEVEDAAIPSSSPKRPLTDHPSENQENHDPDKPAVTKDTLTPPKDSPIPANPMPIVDIPMMSPSQGSPASTNPLPSADTSTQMNPPEKQHIGPSGNAGSEATPIAKKRKLSPASQQAKQQEKQQERDAKERQKLEEKQRKEEEKRLKAEEKAEEKKKRDAEREEEKRLKEEEKKKREADREEKKKAKDEEKAAKDAAKEEERRKKEEEKLKKERSQMKLNNFFAKPQVPSSASSGVPLSPNKRRASDEATAETAQPAESDYQKAFPEFFLQSHTTVAPPHRFERDSEALKHVRETIDVSLDPTNDSHQHLPFRPSEIFHMIPYRRRRGAQSKTVRDILHQIQTSQGGSTPLTETKGPKPQDQLRHITMKSLKFGEDVRPPYQGTYTRIVPESIAVKISRNPYHRGLPDTNYDYDSEAEWEEPEEGEDLDSEEEDEGSDEGEDDMDGFLDDEDDALVGGKRRLIVGDLEPVSSGIRWATDGVDDEFKQYQIQPISDSVKFPVDPFSTAYWQKPRVVEPPTAKNKVASGPASNRGQTLDVFRVPSGTDATAFKKIVDGCDLSKLGVVELLKKRFPKVSKDTLKTTLDQVAVRVGQKEVDKKWVCRE